MADSPNETTIPHAGCKTPSECRKEQVCLDAWHCSAVHGCNESFNKAMLLAAARRMMEKHS